MRKTICLNGWPKAGKSAVAEILERRFGAKIVDDGQILRDAAPILFRGIDRNDPYTQEGKAKLITINGQTYTVRQALGYLGDCLEQFFGNDYIPDQTMRLINDLPAAPYYVLPSVRKGQGFFYKHHGATVWEIHRNEVPPSDNPFDRWSTRAVDRVLENNGSLAELEELVCWVMFKQFGEGANCQLS